MRLPTRCYRNLVLALIALCALVACEQVLNNPYPAKQAERAFYYTSYSEPPKHLDPTRSYSELAYSFMQQVIETPVEYHYLKRPYELVPATAETVPVPQYFDVDGNRLEGDPSSDKVKKAVYQITLKKGTLYGNHPCFAKTEDGKPYYADLAADDLRNVYDIGDFKHVGTRELLARDYVNQICRMCDPRLECPVYSSFTKYIAGMAEYRAEIEKRLEKIRAERQAAQGVSYNKESDERNNPIVIDYLSIPFAGARAVDDYTYEIILKQKYPQMQYWLAMPFFTPVPQEAIEFFEQGPLKEINLVFNRYPVGTGPYRVARYIPNQECVFVRNENFRKEVYPHEGAPGDEEAGLLADAGKPLPLNDGIVMKLEKQPLPYWNKFMQGYYDSFLMGQTTFDQAVEVTSQGNEASEEMTEKGIRLEPLSQSTIGYLAFNMQDEVVGGYSEKQQKLRQALAIAINCEEFCQIFLPGQGVAAHGPIPPAVFGGSAPVKGRYNSYIYDWDEQYEEPKRKGLAEARRLLAEVGYPDGIGEDGEQLKIRFVSRWYKPGQKTRTPWLRKQLAQVGVLLIDETTDYSTFQDKLLNGNFQLTEWGWNADYPDAENFFFLLWGPNGKKDHLGENTANYDNPKFNELFEKMENMPNTPERLEIIKKMNEIAQRDAPWVYFYVPTELQMVHAWTRNFKAHMLNKYQFKFRRIDLEQRAANRKKWNRPVFWPVVVLALVLLAVAVPALRVVYRNR